MQRRVLNRQLAEQQKVYAQAAQRYEAFYSRLVHALNDHLQPSTQRVLAQRTFDSDSTIDMNHDWSDETNEGRERQQKKARQLEMEALATLAEERPNILRALWSAHERGRWKEVAELAQDLAIFLYQASYRSDWLEVTELAARDAALAGDPKLEVEALNYIGVAYRQVGNLTEAETYLSRALELYRQLEDREGEALVLGNMAGIHFAGKAPDIALEYYEGAFEVFQELRNKVGQALSLMGMGISLVKLHRLEEAGSRLQQALDLHKNIGDRFGESQALNNLGIVQRLRGQPEKAIVSVQASLQIKREIGDRYGTALALSNLARAFYKLGLLEQAIEAWEEGLELFEGLDAPDVERIANHLDQVRHELQAKEPQGNVRTDGI
jgi:tetratricopeptide (TPR) repeat protein